MEVKMSDTEKKDTTVQELDNSVKEEVLKACTKDELQKAIDALTGSDLNKSDKPNTEKPAEEELEVEEEDLEDEDEEDLDKAPDVNDVKAGIVSADKFLDKALDLIRVQKVATLKLAKAVQILTNDLAKAHKVNEDNFKKLKDADAMILKAAMILPDLQKAPPKKEEPAIEPKMAGKEGDLNKGVNQVTNTDEKKELSEPEIQTLWKACYVEKKISADEFRKAKLTGTMPESLK